MYPQFAEEDKPLPNGAVRLGPTGSYALLAPRTEHAQVLSSAAQAKILLDIVGLEYVQRWGRILLPNGQVVRSRFSEDRARRQKRRVARMIKVALKIYSLYHMLTTSCLQLKRSGTDNIHFAEVQFFFQHNRAGYALVSVYSRTPGNGTLTVPQLP
jgi:hypothetical protein